MHLLNPFDNDYKETSNLFEAIFQRNAISILGAGASVTDKKFLSKEIIDEYEGKHSLSLETNDIIEFVDILEKKSSFDRREFDTFVVDRLNKLRPTEAHKSFVRIPWRKIFTTNFDTLVEDAEIDIIQNKTSSYRIKPIKNKQQLDSTVANNEIKYIKLNGCKTDLGLYPLVFSSRNFADQKNYYEKALKPYKGLSPEVKLISFGYSFTDLFAKKVFELMDSTDFRQKKPLYCVDPFLNEERLEFLSSKNIIGVKCTFEDFILGYDKWFINNNKRYLDELQSFKNVDNSKIHIDKTSRIILGGNLVQLNDDYSKGNKISKKDFYLGSNPNYQVVVKNYDVIKQQQAALLSKKITETFDKDFNSTVPNFLLIDGDFGTGKTTFVYRGIYSFLATNDDTLAFEFINVLEIKRGSIIELIENSNAKRFIFYCDHIENDSTYKRFAEIRAELSTTQYSNRKIIFISSIRENILNKLINTNGYKIKNLIQYHFNPKYNQSEVEQLVDNLNELGIKRYRDQKEKNILVDEIFTKYNGDSFIALLQTVKNGKHLDILESAFEELSNEMKSAFKITSLIHRFGMKCPIELIKNATPNMEWGAFIDNVMKGDGKGILFQEYNKSIPEQPDLFFITKHPLIADALIKRYYSDAQKYNAYKSIFQTISYSEYNAIFLVDLLKNISRIDTTITVGQREALYEIAKNEFAISIHFMLSYVTNIEKTHNDINRLKECIEELEILESDITNRNHRIIHRKGCLNFKIAVLTKKNKDETREVNKYLRIAEEWFDIKKHLDQVSEYSYVDYLKLLKWEYLNINLTDERKIELITTAQNLFDDAKRNVFINFEKVNVIFTEFLNDTNNSNDTEYLEQLLEWYQIPSCRSKAALLLFYFYENQDKNKAYDLVQELKTYTDDLSVVNFLFKYYGRNLHIADNRSRFFELTRKNDFLEINSPLRFYYFSYIAEFYNYSFREGKNKLFEISKVAYSKFNPDFYLYWLNQDGEKELFDGDIIEENKILKIKLHRLSKPIKLIKSEYIKIKANDEVKVFIRFMFDGLQAEIV